MKAKNTISFSSIMLILAVACSAMQTPQSQIDHPIETILPTISTTPITPSVTLSTTPSSLPSLSMTPATTASPMSTPDPRLAFRCVDILSSPTADMKIQGISAIHSFIDGDTYLLNLSTGEKNSLGEDVFNVSVTPDRSKLAYIRLHPGQLVLMDNRSRQLVSIPASAITLDPDWDDLIGWLNQEHILIARRRDFPRGSFIKRPSLIVLNPSTREQQEYIPEDYPNHYVADIWSLAWNSNTRLIPDPALTRLVYPAFGEGADTAVILWDLEAGKVITRIEVLSTLFGGTPVWLSDGSAFVVAARIRLESDDYRMPFDNLPGEPYVNGLELLIVSRDGEIQRLTHLTNTYIAAPGEMALSPDERYLAYWLTIMDNRYPGERLAVADMLTGQVTNYCIAGYSESEGQSPAPVWSPDGKYLAVTIPDPEIRRQINVLVVDLYHGKAVEIAEKAEFLGWLVNTP